MLNSRRSRAPALAVLLIGIFSAPLASAHATLVRSTPAANSTVDAVERIDLQFNEAVVARASRVEIFMAHGKMHMAVPMTTTELLEDGRSLRVTLAKPLSTGSYQVQWRAVGPDGHPMNGELKFAVK